MTAYVSATRTFSDGYLLNAADLTSMRSDILADAAPPAASQTVRGTVKASLQIAAAGDGTLSLAQNGATASQVMQWTGSAWAPVTLSGSYSLPPATTTALGGVKVGSGLAVDGTGLLTTTAGTGTAAPAAPTPLSTSQTISNSGTYKITTAGITVTLATPTAGTFPVYTFTLDRLAGASTATVTGPGTNSIYVGTTGTATTSVVLQGGDTWQIQWDGTYFCTLLQPLSQQLSGSTPAGTGITSATLFYGNDAGTDVTYTAAAQAAFAAANRIWNTYTASGAIAPTDDRAIVNVTGTATVAMTLALGSVPKKAIRIKRMGAAPVSVTAMIDGTSQTILLNKTAYKESIELELQPDLSTYVLF